MGNNPTLTLRIKVNNDGTAEILNGTSRSINRIGTEVDSATSAINRFSGAIARVGNYSALLVGGLGISATAKGIVMLADNMTLIDSRIKLATSNNKDYLSSQKALLAISLQTGTAFEANAQLFSRISKAMESMGGTTQHTTALTRTLAESLRISGTSAGEAASVIRQMSQALASGVLRGDEFNSLMENAPRLTQALADGLHVTIGSLRAMAEAGELTSKKVITAIQSQSAVIDEEFKKIPLTVGAAMENVNTSFSQYIFNANKGAGATAGLAQIINSLAGNITPVVDGVVTLGKVAATVFAGQMVASLMTYIAAKQQAIALEAVQNAHTEALIINRQRDVAATVAQADAALLAARNQLALNAAQVSGVQSMLAGNTSMTQRMALTNQLNVALSAQAGLTATITTATEAQAIVQAELNAAMAAGTTKITAMSVAMGVLNAALVVFTAFQIKSYLEELYTGSDFAAKSLGALATWIEEVSRRFSLAKAIFTSDTWDEVNAASEKTKQSYIDLTNEMLANNEAARNQTALSGDLKAALEALKTPQEVYEQKVKDTNEALKANAISQAQGTELLAKYKETLNQANAAAATAKLSEAGKEIVKLQDQYAKLTLSVEDYNATHAKGIAGTDAERSKVTELANAIDKLEAGKKTLTKTTKDYASEAKKAAQEEENFQAKAIGFLNGQAEQLRLLKLTGKERELETKISSDLNSVLGELYDSTKVYTEAKALLIAEAMNNTRAIAAETEAQEAQKKGLDAGKAAMAAEIDRYKQLTLSAREYFIEKLKLQNVPADQIAPIVKQFDVNTGIEAGNKKMEDAHSALEKYNTELTKTNKNTADLGATTTSIFDGALGGLNTLTGALDSMVKSIQKNTDSFEALRIKQKEVNDIKLDPKSKTYTADIKLQGDLKKKYEQDYRELQNKSLNDSIDGIRQVASATAQMFEQNSTEAKAFNLIALAGLAAKAAVAVLTQGEGDPYTAFARIAAMAALVGGIVQAGGGGGFNFSGASAPPKPTSSPDSGTVLGDSTAKSESINNTYELLKDIHAEEYAELKGINQGIAALSAGITNTITRLFQAGGIKDFATLQPSKMTGIAAHNLVTNGSLLKDPIGDFLLSGIFGGKQTQSVIGQGIATLPASIADILAGKDFPARQYAEIQTKTSGGWFGKDKYRTSMQYAALDEATQTAMDDVFKNMADTMVSVAEQLGHDTKGKIEAYIIPALTINLKDLSGEDAAKKLTNVISAALDTMADTVFGDIIGKHQQLGEGMLETAIRIVAEVAVVKDALAASGLSLATNAIDISDALVQAAGGLAEFQKQFESFYDKFYTDSEKQDRLQARLTWQLSEVNLALAATREGYRKQVEALDLATASGQAQYTTLLKLSGAADGYYKTLEDASQQLAEQRRGLDIALMEQTGNAISALTERRKDELKALDESLRFTQKVIWSLQDLTATNKAAETEAKKATTDAMAVLQAAVTAEKTAVTAKYADLIQITQTALDELTRRIPAAFAILQKAVATRRTAIDNAYNAALKNTNSAIEAITDSVSSLLNIANMLKTAVNQNAVATMSRKDAQGQLVDALRTGRLDETIISNALAVIGKPSEELFSTLVDYQRDFLTTANTISDLSALANGQVTTGQTQLDALNIQIENSKLAHDAQMSALDDILTAAQAQIDAANGTTVAVMSITDAQGNLTEATTTAGKIQQDSLTAQLGAYKAASLAETSRLDKILADAQLQLDAANGTIKAVMSVKDAISNLADAIAAQTAQAAQAQAELSSRLSSIDIANKAAQEAAAARLAYEQSQAQAGNTANARDSAIKKAAADQLAADQAAANAARLANPAPAPTTWQNGQTGNTIWEKVLSEFNAAHSAKFGVAMNRPWSADGDAQAAYNALVAQYNALSTSAAAAATAAAAGLAEAAKASAALVPGLQSQAAADAQAAAQTQAAHSTASAYSAATEQAALGAYKEGATATGYQSSAGASYSAATGIITGTAGTSMPATDIIKWVNDMLAAGNARAVYDGARANGLSAVSLDALMSWTPGTSNHWAEVNGLPKFASGGDHSGGWRVVGENGPELERTGPSHIFSNPQSKSLVDNTELIAEIKALREEVVMLRYEARATASAANKTAKILRDVTQDGTSITTSVAV